MLEFVSIESVEYEKKGYLKLVLLERNLTEN